MGRLNTIDEMIEISLGIKGGRELQVLAGDRFWGTAAYIITGELPNFRDHKYRLKPEPRAIEIEEDDYIEIYLENSKITIEGPAKFVEVLDD